MPNPYNLPATLLDEYETLRKQVCRLWVNWDVFLQLYADVANVTLLNRTAPGFFFLCQDALVDAVILAVSRLTDPAQTQGKPNLTLPHLVEELCAAVSDAALQTQLRSNLAAVRTVVEPARRVRNQRVAHLDLPSHRGVTPLFDTTRNELEGAVQAILAFMHFVDSTFLETDVVYEMASFPGDGRVLLRVLRRGQLDSLAKEVQDLARPGE